MNPSFEIDDGNGGPANWHIGGFGTNTVEFAYPADAQHGSRGAGLTITDYTDGDAKWYFDDVAVTAGEEYQFTDYYKGNATSSVVIRYNLGGGNYSYSQIATLPPSADWQQFVGTFTPPAGTVSVTVFHLLQSAGTLFVDNYRLVEISLIGPGPDSFSEGFVTLTFDDGWTSNYNFVLPVLSNAGLPGSFFVITNEAANADDSNLGNPDSYLTYERIHEIENAGNEVSAHTRTHPSLTSLSIEDATAEVSGSRDDLLNEGFSPVETFVYPYGNYNQNIIQLVSDTGFTGARSVEEGYNTKATNRFALKTQNVLVGTTAQQMKHWIDTAIANKTWLIMTFHQVDNAGLDYSTTPAILQEIADYLNLHNVQVRTLREGLQLLP